MRPAHLAAAALVAFFVLNVAAAPREATVSRSAVDPLERIDVTIPGKLLSMVSLREGDSGHSIMLLVEPVAIAEVEPASDCATTQAPRGPLELWEVRPASAGADVRPLRRDLPPEVAAIHAADLDSDGRDELLLIRPTGVSLLQRAPSDHTTDSETRLLDAEAFDAAGETLAHSRLELEPGSRLLKVAGLGHTRFFRLERAPEQERLPLLAEIATPVRQQLRRNGLRIVGTEVSWIGRNPNGGEWFASVPESLGDRRLRSLLLAPDDAAPDSQRRECWMRLPAAERLVEHAFRMIDGKPRLIVTTMPADKLDLFGEKRLRVFDLQADRSRLGFAPLFAADTRINLWQPTHFWIRDGDGDGRDDLILGYWKGINKDRIVLDLYRGNGAGGFAAKPQNTAFDVKDADRSFLQFGRDLDGDGIDDLLIIGKRQLRWHPGTPPSKRRKSLVSHKPRWVIDLGRATPESAEQFVGLGFDGVSSSFSESSGLAPRPIDWDNDGQVEIYYASDDTEKHELILSLVVRRR